MSASGKASRSTVEVTIRKLAATDVPAVSAILRESPEAAAWSQESLLQLASAESPAWVADLNGAVAGFLIGRTAADEFEILNMAVSQAHRRSGIGSKLLESALEFSRIAGSASAHLEVRASNAPAIALYARQGFTESGRRTHYYRDPVEDAVLLSLHLGGTH
jgi:[ribosomal protein S18]-alanine N-acetyltransferase